MAARLIRADKEESAKVLSLSRRAVKSCRAHILETLSPGLLEAWHWTDSMGNTFPSPKDHQV